MLTEDYCDFETAKLLKEKGFDGSVSGYYHIWDNGSPVCTVSEFMHSEAPHLYVIAPTLQIAMKWLREVHNISIEPCSNTNSHYSVSVYVVMIKEGIVCNNPTIEYNSYEEAVEAAIKYVLENII